MKNQTIKKKIVGNKAPKSEGYEFYPHSEHISFFLAVAFYSIAKF